MKSLKTTAALFISLVVLFPAIAPAQTMTTSSGASISVQQLIALYTQIITLLDQEIAQLTASQASTPATHICPSYALPACTGGTLVPQGDDSNGCQLPAQCEANTNSAPVPTTTATPVINTAPAPTCTLTASPSSITEGQSATLSWTSSNSSGGSIAQIGSVLSSGSQTVTPAQTTDYVGAFMGVGGGGYCTALVTVVPVSTPIVATTTSVNGMWAPIIQTQTTNTGASCTTSDGVTVQNGYSLIPANQGVGGQAESFFYKCVSAQWYSMGTTLVSAPAAGTGYTIAVYP